MKAKVRRLVTAALAAVFLISAAVIVTDSLKNRHAQAGYEEARRLAGLSSPGEFTAPAPSESAAPAESSDEASSPALPLPERTPDVPEEEGEMAGIDLPALRAVNPDVVGWIAIPGTPLSYPLVQGTDNDYYLNHTWEKKRASLGAIYVDWRNAGDLSDFHTVIYGHRMDKTTMFSSLQYYEDEDYWREHPSVYIVTDGGVRRYDIFSAARVHTVEGNAYQLDIPENERQGYIDDCLARSVLDAGVEVAADGHIITLSTCTSQGGDSVYRWVVQAVLREEKKV